ncbi:MAG: hypothetical protein AB7E31_07780 [Desulfitobacterium sp.]
MTEKEEWIVKAIWGNSVSVCSNSSYSCFINYPFVSIQRNKIQLKKQTQKRVS